MEGNAFFTPRSLFFYSTKDLGGVGMPEFKSKEEYEKWKTEKLNKIKATNKNDDIDNSSKEQVEKIKEKESSNLGNNEVITKKKGINKKIILIGIGLFIGIIITYAVMKIFAPQISPNQLTSSQINIKTKEAIDEDLRKLALDALKEMDDLKYGFKVGISYVNFRDQKFVVLKKIASIEDNFSNNANLNIPSTNILSFLMAASVYLEILDCIWKNKIEDYSKQCSYEYSRPFSLLDGFYNYVSLCVMDYTKGPKGYLMEKPFCKYAFDNLQKYYEGLSSKYEVEKSITKAAEEKYPSRSSYAARQEYKGICEKIPLPYLQDFMTMYSTEVDNIHGALK